MYWQYKCYDNDNRIINGVIKMPSFDALVLHIRNSGWQIITASTIDRQQFISQKRINKLKKMNSSNRPSENINKIMKEYKLTWFEKLILFISKILKL